MTMVQLAIFVLSSLLAIEIAQAFAPPSSSTFLFMAHPTRTSYSAQHPPTSSSLSYQATGTETDYLTSQDAVIIAAPQQQQQQQHINDANYEALLSSTRSVLVDCYVAKCGPCKLIEGSIQSIMPKYTTTSDSTSDTTSEGVQFCKWDAETREQSQQFMNTLRTHEMTFRKLPTLILFVDGEPVAMRSGMASPGQIDRFLQENLPSPSKEDEIIMDEIETRECCVDEINLQGEKISCVI